MYAASVDKIIDGDTIMLMIDLGFGVWKQQRVRLAAIDTPAMDEQGGLEAFSYVRDQLAKAMVVMVKTNKIDIYGRYVGHVFYALNDMDKAKVFEQGRYLNQELLTLGLARAF